MAEKKPDVTETVLSIQLTQSGHMKIERVTLRNGTVQKRETFAEDMPEICMAKLEQQIRHARLTGGQV